MLTDEQKDTIAGVVDTYVAEWIGDAWQEILDACCDTKEEYEWAEDEAMIEAFQDDQDIHATTAAAIYGVSIDDVTPAMRRHAKAVNFGLIYGPIETCNCKDEPEEDSPMKGLAML